MSLPSVPPAGDSLPLLDPEIRYSGQSIAVVIAETLEAAEHAAELVQVEYDTQPPSVVMEDGLRQSFVPNSGNRPAESKRGNFASAAASAAVKVDAVYRTPAEHHNPMEPHATTATWDGNRLTVYDATQGVGNTAQNLAEQFNLEHEDVHVVDPFVGGGFGCKGQSWPHVALTAAASKLVGRPVRLALTRRQMFSSIGHRPERTFSPPAATESSLRSGTRPTITRRSATSSWNPPADRRRCCMRAPMSTSAIGSSG